MVEVGLEVSHFVPVMHKLVPCRCYSVSMLSKQFVINSSVEFVACEVRDFFPAWYQKQSNGNLSMLRCGRYAVQNVRCFLFSILSRTLVTPNFKYGKLFHACN